MREKSPARERDRKEKGVFELLGGVKKTKHSIFWTYNPVSVMERELIHEVGYIRGREV